MTVSLKLLLPLSIAAAAGLAYSAGAFDALDAQRLEASFRSLGAWGPLLYVVLFASLEAFFVPGIVFVIPGGLVWDWPTLFLLSQFGATGSAVIGYSFARTVGHDFVQQRISGRAAAYDAALARNGLRTVVILRLIFFIAPWVNWLIGLSRVRFRDYLLGTIIGFAPMMAAFTWFWSRGVEHLSERPFLFALLAVFFVLLMIGMGRAFHRHIQADVAAAT